jgi:hypothetical protein
VDSSTAMDNDEIRTAPGSGDDDMSNGRGAACAVDDADASGNGSGCAGGGGGGEGVIGRDVGADRAISSRLLIICMRTARRDASGDV